MKYSVKIIIILFVLCSNYTAVHFVHIIIISFLFLNQWCKISAQRLDL